MNNNSFNFLQPKILLRSWRKKQLPTDFLAGLTVAAIAIPQSMAYTQLAHVPISTGLYTALVAMIAYGLFTSSKRVIVGPDTAMSIMTGAAITPLIVGNPESATFYAVILATLVGGFCIIGAKLKLYYIAEFLSRPILLGYLMGVAIVIISDQIPKMFGLAIGGENAVHNLYQLSIQIPNAHTLTMILSISLLVIGLLLKKLLPKIPIAILLLVIASVASMIYGFAELGVTNVGNIPAGLPNLDVPKMSFDSMQTLLFPAGAIALVSFADTIATARSFASKNHEDVSTNQELTSLGIANLAVVPVGGMPVSASGSRTAVNDNLKAKSQFSQLYASGIIALVLIAFSEYLSYIPKFALAVIIILSAYTLFDFKEVKSIWRGWRSEAILAFITAGGVAFLGILPGLGLAIALAVANLVRRSAFPHDAVLGVSEDGLTFRDRSRPPKTFDIPGLIIYRFDAPLYFGNANYFKNRILDLVNESSEKINWFLLDAESISSIDSTGAKTIKSILHELNHRDIGFATARLKGPIRDTLRSTHLGTKIENRPHFPSIGKAYEEYCEKFEVPSRRHTKAN
ncbi:MAG TPA: SulP family inorganic anion transporter [Candidatus Saccharibacteria bacterium]|nr:SulP family inorganic anion transporter [Candidatus Saccharibacteria bacterium]